MEDIVKVLIYKILECKPPCLDCSSINWCKECPTGQIIYSGECKTIGNCIKPKNQDYKLDCKDCNDPNCNGCKTDLIECYECKSGYYLDENKLCIRCNDIIGRFINGPNCLSKY